MVIDHLTVGPFQTNVYVIGCRASGAGAVVDAGGDGPGLIAMAARHEVSVGQILQTHAHVDHVAALTHVKRATSAPILLHPDDAMLYDNAVQQGRFFGFQIEALPPVDQWLAHDQEVRVGELVARVMLLPGHSPGSVAFYFEDEGVLLSGDVLFAGSIGRTDLPGGDGAAMMRSLDALKQLPPQTRVFSGHGPATTIGQELRFNPFMR
jgi:glyoxylase-like metal-dependent hydrolase (beta-lactamase superfamily II)